MKIDYVQTNFSTGEVSDSLVGRVDISQYNNACEVVENMLVRPYGPLISTPGTEFISQVKTVTGGAIAIKLIDFVFSRTDSYIIEMGQNYFRFYTDGAVVSA